MGTGAEIPLGQFMEAAEPLQTVEGNRGTKTPPAAPGGAQAGAGGLVVKETTAPGGLLARGDPQELLEEQHLMERIPTGAVLGAVGKVCYPPLLLTGNKLN